eukprot:2434036-Pleurochrysis_carterae.AAC.1
MKFKDVHVHRCTLECAAEISFTTDYHFLVSLCTTPNGVRQRARMRCRQVRTRSNDHVGVAGACRDTCRACFGSAIPSTRLAVLACAVRQVRTRSNDHVGVAGACCDTCRACSGSAIPSTRLAVLACADH